MQNSFFYDGKYWVYQAENWYASSWYHGPWELVNPDAVPLYVLRVPVRYYREPPRYFRESPVRYYREPPQYFREWRADAPPRWGEHWGAGWERNHAGSDRWNRSAAPLPPNAPDETHQWNGDARTQAAPNHR